MRTKVIATGLLAGSALGGISAPATAADLPVKVEPVAPQQVSGYLAMEAGFSWMKNGGTYYFTDSGYSGSDNKWMVNGAARVNVWWGRNYSTQFDVWGGFDSFGRNQNENKGVNATINLGAHYSYRDAR